MLFDGGKVAETFSPCFGFLSRMLDFICDKTQDCLVMWQKSCLNVKQVYNNNALVSNKQVGVDL